MVRRRRVEPFFMIVTDSDEKTFNVLGPMSDDTQINHKVVLWQERGRHVNCHSSGLGHSREQLIANYKRESGFEYTDEPIAD
jgi:hypothetical protein